LMMEPAARAALTAMLSIGWMEEVVMDCGGRDFPEGRARKS
jgi:hypothetical protein